MITLKKCTIKNWDGSQITPLLQIQDRMRLKLKYLELVRSELQHQSINRRFHDEPRRVVNELIRWCHGAMGMYASSSSGCLYYERTQSVRGYIVEHVIPVTDLVDLYFNDNVPLSLLLFFPVARISKESNTLLGSSAKSNANHAFPFRRYALAGFEDNIYTHKGDLINLSDFSLNDHFSLVREVASPKSHHFNYEYSQIFTAFDIEQNLSHFLSKYQLYT